jgi:hypothetical protein
MALPKLTAPIFSTILPETKQEVSFRPWLVGDKKALLVAMQAEDTDMVRRTTFEVLGKCIMTPGIDIAKLPATDVSWLMMHVRMRSDSDVIEMALQIKDCKQKPDCVRRVKIDLNDVIVRFDPAHVNVIRLTDTIGIKMRSPTLEEAQEYFALAEIDKQKEHEAVVALYFDIIGMCIETVFDGDEVTPAKDVTKAELRDFIASMTDKQFGEIEKFFKTMPSLYYKVDTTCKECGRKIEYELNGLTDFFG